MRCATGAAITPGTSGQWHVLRYRPRLTLLTSAAGACLGLGRQRPHLLDYRQQQAGTVRPWPLLPDTWPRGRRVHPVRLRLRCRDTLLAPFALEPLLKVADSRLRKLQLLFNGSLASNGPVVLVLPVAAIPFKLDVLLLGQ